MSRSNNVTSFPQPRLLLLMHVSSMTQIKKFSSKRAVFVSSSVFTIWEMSERKSFHERITKSFSFSSIHSPTRSNFFLRDDARKRFQKSLKVQKSHKKTILRSEEIELKRVSTSINNNFSLSVKTATMQPIPIYLGHCLSSVYECRKINERENV